MDHMGNHPLMNSNRARTPRRKISDFSFFGEGGKTSTRLSQFGLILMKFFRVEKECVSNLSVVKVEKAPIGKIV